MTTKESSLAGLLSDRYAYALYDLATEENKMNKPSETDLMEMRMTIRRETDEKQKKHTNEILKNENVQMWNFVSISSELFRNMCNQNYDCLCYPLP